MNPIGIPADVKFILKKLKFVARIPPDRKPAVSNDDALDLSPPGWMAAISRRWAGEGRERLIGWISQLVEQTRDLLVHYSRPETKEIFEVIRSNFSSCRQGLNNLKDTYSSSPSVVAQIEVEVDNINLILSSHD